MSQESEPVSCKFEILGANMDHQECMQTFKILESKYKVDVNFKNAFNYACNRRYGESYGAMELVQRFCVNVGIVIEDDEDMAIECLLSSLKKLNKINELVKE